MDKLFSDFVEFIERNKLIVKNDSIVLACSGGVDSTVLLHLLYKLKENFEFVLTVAHFNHSLRGEDSDGDEKFVKDLAYRLNLPFYSSKEDVKKYSDNSNLSIQEGARILRYRFLQEICKKFRIAKIATGHNIDDKIETIFYHLLKGYGLYSLCGIPEKRDNVIRPLIFAGRKEIEIYAAKNKIEHRIDKSNFEAKYLRNKIRLRLFPEIKDFYVKDFQKNILSLGSEADETVSFIDYHVKKAFDESVIKKKESILLLQNELFKSYFSVVRKRLIYYILIYKFRIAEKLGSGILKEIENLILNGRTGG